MPDSEVRLGLLRDALSSCCETFKENTRISALLDDKAQKTGAVAGLFLAAAFGFAKKENIADLFTLLGYSGVALLAVGVFLFLSCVFACLRVMWVRSSSGPPAPQEIFDVTQTLLQIGGGTSEEMRENHLRDQIRAWLSILNVQKSVNESKARRLKAGQWILAIGMVLLSIILVLLLLASSGWCSPQSATLR